MPLLVAAVGCQPAPEPEPEPAPVPEMVVPQFEVDPSWPALPNDWVLGSVASVDVADDDHVWVYHRPLSVEDNPETPRDFVAASTPIGDLGAEPGTGRARRGLQTQAGDSVADRSTGFDLQM